ncbi:MAG TPA: adenylate/guanylate cyclase domain-containing protein [Dongiaceae bacterium]
MRTTIGKLSRYWVILALVAGLVIGWWQPGDNGGLASALEGRLLDLRHVVRGPVPPPDDFAIVAIDDKTLGRLHRFPAPRTVIATCIDRLTDAGAKVVAVDLLLLEHEAPSEGDSLSAGDAILASAIARNAHVVLAGSQTADQVPDEDLIRRNAFSLVASHGAQEPRPLQAVAFWFPISAFAASAQVAHANLLPDPDGTLRRIALAAPIATRDYLPAMPLEAVRQLRGVPRSDVELTLGESIRLGRLVILLSAADNTIGLNHYGQQGTFPTYSMIDVIDGKISADRFTGRAVFIGSTATGQRDAVQSPFAAQVPGVEALTAAAANIVDGHYLKRNLSTLVIDVAVAALLSILAFIAANQRSLAVAAAATILLWVGTATGVQLAFSQAYLWLDATTYVVALVAIGLATFAARIVQQRSISGQLQHERDNLARYQSPLLTEFLAEQQSPSFNERAQEAAVMFVDVSAFTRRAERLGPTATVEFLRDLHGRIERAALANRGVIEQFMGDGAMIIFGLPEPKPDDAARALAASRQLIGSLGDWNLDLEAAGQEPVRLRIGLHNGPVIAALVGGAQQGQVTVAGDTVNVASRLQEMGKEHKAAIVASAGFVAAVHRAGRDDMLTGMRRLAGQKVRGRAETIDLWVWP